MKKFLFALLLLTGSAPAQAQYMKGEVCLDGGIGLQFPTGDLEDQVKTGNHFALGAGMYVNTSWYLGLRICRESFDPKPAEVVATGLSMKEYWNVELETRLMLYPESWFTPYIMAGGGWYRERASHNPGMVEIISTTARGAVMSGFGLNIHRQPSHISMYTEVVYHHIPTGVGSDQFVRWTSGLRYSFGGRPF